MRWNLNCLGSGKRILDLAVKSGLVTLNGWRMKAERATK